MRHRVSPYIPTSRIRQIFLLGSLSAALLTATGADAASVLGDEFQIEGNVGGLAFGPDTGVAGQLVGSFDVEASPDPDIFIRVRWVDADSFDLHVVEVFQTGLDADVSLVDLDFETPGGQAAAIVGASFDPTGNNYLGFFKSEENPTGANRPSDPSVSFTSGSVRVTFGADWESQLFFDSPILRFDVLAVPEPGTLAMVLAGLGALGLARRRNG